MLAGRGRRPWRQPMTESHREPRIELPRSPSVRVVRTPGWIVRAAVIAFLLVVALPVLILLAVALVIASALFGVLWLGNRATLRLRGHDREGRENVRVIRPNDEGRS